MLDLSGFPTPVIPEEACLTLAESDRKSLSPVVPNTVFKEDNDNILHLYYTYMEVLRLRDKVSKRFRILPRIELGCPFELLNLFNRIWPPVFPGPVLVDNLGTDEVQFWKNARWFNTRWPKTLVWFPKKLTYLVLEWRHRVGRCDTF